MDGFARTELPLSRTCIADPTIDPSIAQLMTRIYHSKLNVLAYPRTAGHFTEFDWQRLPPTATIPARSLIGIERPSEPRIFPTTRVLPPHGVQRFTG